MKLTALLSLAYLALPALADPSPTPNDPGWVAEFTITGTARTHKDKPTPSPSAKPSPIPKPSPTATPTASPGAIRPVVAGLDNYILAFDEEFDGPVSMPTGTGWDSGGGSYRWMCHTPYAGDFGEAYFSGPVDGKGSDGHYFSPFSTSGGVLTITAWRDTTINHWRSGLISSVGTAGKGFSQAMGYWECRVKCPSGPGVWPAFWLAGVGGIKGQPSAEIDVLEAYGVDLTKYHCNVHWWNTGKDGGDGATIGVPDLSAGWHVFSCLIQSDFIRFYFDGKEVWKYATYDLAKLPLYVMVDLGLGGGWPVDQTPNPSKLLVDYVRVFAAPAR